MITAFQAIHQVETYNKEYSTISINDAKEALIVFAKLHIKEALKQASEKVECKTKYKTLHGGEHDGIYVNKLSILNAYDLDNIK